MSLPVLPANAVNHVEIIISNILLITAALVMKSVLHISSRLADVDGFNSKPLVFCAACAVSEENAGSHGIY
jgi:hypothetical protein